MKTWKPGLTPEEERDIAYEERNMLALLLATIMSVYVMPGTDAPASGWYRHPPDEVKEGSPEHQRLLLRGTSELPAYWEDPAFSFHGWSRVISLYNGSMTFHVPDGFDLGALPEIEPNWDGHSTEEKWALVKHLCRGPEANGVDPDDQSVRARKIRRVK